MFFGEITQAEAMFLDIWLVLCKTFECWEAVSLKAVSVNTTLVSGLLLFMRWKLRRFEEIWGGITNIFEEICQNLAQNLRRVDGISHMYVLVNLTFTDVMTTNITVYSRRKTTFTVGEKWNLFMKLCNLHYIILTIWTHIICKWTNTLSH